jgi:hypothetical protein
LQWIEGKREDEDGWVEHVPVLIFMSGARVEEGLPTKRNRTVDTLRAPLD